MRGRESVCARVEFRRLFYTREGQRFLPPHGRMIRWSVQQKRPLGDVRAGCGDVESDALARRIDLAVYFWEDLEFSENCAIRGVARVVFGLQRLRRLVLRGELVSISLPYDSCTKIVLVCQRRMIDCCFKI